MATTPRSECLEKPFGLFIHLFDKYELNSTTWAAKIQLWEKQILPSFFWDSKFSRKDDTHQVPFRVKLQRQVFWLEKPGRTGHLPTSSIRLLKGDDTWPATWSRYGRLVRGAQWMTAVVSIFIVTVIINKCGDALQSSSIFSQINEGSIKYLLTAYFVSCRNWMLSKPTDLNIHKSASSLFYF